MNTATNYDDMRRFFSQAKYLVGHNAIRWDIPNLERVLGIKIKSKVIDSLALSWILSPDRNKHGIESYGEDFGIKKPPINDWENLPIETYIYRCQEDVKITTRLWESQYRKLLELYGSEKKIFEYLDYISFKMQCARLQEESGWKIDVDYCYNNLTKLLEEQKTKLDALIEVMPKVPVIQVKTRPKRMEKQDGTLTKIGQAWSDLLAEQKLPWTTLETEVVVGYEEGNPKSTVQVKNWLFDLGWKPQTFKQVKNKETKETREIPQINQENGKGICESIKLLYEKKPALELLDGLSILNHRIPILRSFLSTRDDNDRVKAQIQGLTNTLRFQHSMPCVNLPRIDRPYAEPIRGSLIADDGYVLCGADKSGLEDRLKHHFIFPYDPDYVHNMMRDDYDPHLTLAVMAGMLPKDDMNFYVWYDRLTEEEKKNCTPDIARRIKSIKPIRSIAKNGNYACQYGAYPPRLMITCSIDAKAAKILFDGYWKLNWAIKKAIEDQTVKKLKDGSLWLLNPINHFWYSLRTKNDIFSTLVQGSASYVFDLWVQFVLEERRQLTAQFHDEIVLCIKEGFEKEAEELLLRALYKTNEQLKLNRQLGIGIQFGKRYSEIH